MFLFLLFAHAPCFFGWDPFEVSVAVVRRSLIAQGKTLSILCSAMQWLRDHYAQEDKGTVDAVETRKFADHTRANPGLPSPPTPPSSASVGAFDGAPTVTGPRAPPPSVVPAQASGSLSAVTPPPASLPCTAAVDSIGSGAPCRDSDVGCGGCTSARNSAKGTPAGHAPATCASMGLFGSSNKRARLAPTPWSSSRWSSTGGWTRPTTSSAPTAAPPAAASAFCSAPTPIQGRSSVHQPSAARFATPEPPSLPRERSGTTTMPLVPGPAVSSLFPESTAWLGGPSQADFQAEQLRARVIRRSRRRRAIEARVASIRSGREPTSWDEDASSGASDDDVLAVKPTRGDEFDDDTNPGREDPPLTRVRLLVCVCFGRIYGRCGR